jgi:hypothetical protein
MLYLTVLEVFPTAKDDMAEAAIQVQRQSVTTTSAAGVDQKELVSSSSVSG